MNFRPRQKEEPEINLIPFIDVLLVVLIFLMLSTTYSKFTELQLKLPVAVQQVDGRAVVFVRQSATRFERRFVDTGATAGDLVEVRGGVRAGEPDRLLNLPVAMSENAPNTLTTGLYVGILGEFSNYWIADALDMQVQRLTELYAETNQTGFIGRMESDGMPVLAEAFVRVKLA